MKARTTAWTTVYKACNDRWYQNLYAVRGTRAQAIWASGSRGEWERQRRAGFVKCVRVTMTFEVPTTKKRGKE